MVKEYFTRLFRLSLESSKSKKNIDLPDLDNVYLLFNAQERPDQEYFVDDQTAIDLNLDALFFRTNYNSSKLGQQFLYHLLRCPPKENHRLEYINSVIDTLEVDNHSRQKTIKRLKKLNKNDDYYIINYLTHESIKQPSWFFITYVIQVFIISLFVVAAYNHFFVILLMGLFLINFILHYKTKQLFNNFFIGLSRISVLYKTANHLFRSHYLNKNDISTPLSNAKNVVAKLWLFQTNNLQQSEVAMIGWLLIEIIKIISLVEVQATYSISKRFENHKADFLALYNFVAEIDVAISIIEFRNSLPVYSVPVFTDKVGHIEFENVHHPLLDDCHPNNIFFNKKSVFITGSNMSGKTTFIRTVGLNVLMARSLNTCIASKAILAKYNVYSSINISDKLDEGKSFYLAELSRLKYFVDLSTEPKENNLFLIDEILKGTNGYDRCQISEGILKFIIESDKNIIIASSHDINLIDKLKSVYKFYYFEENFKDNEVAFDFLLKEGVSTKSNAIKFLNLLQFPDTISNKMKA